MKPSGIDWIGEIPEHWETNQLKRCAKIILGKMLSNSPNNQCEYICAKDVHYDGVDVSDLKKMSFSKSEKELYEVKKGDMLIVEGGAGAGGCAIYDKEKEGICIQNSIMIVRCKQCLLNDYLCLFMQSINRKGYIDFICNKATIPHFTKEKVGAVIVPIPSKKEQEKIVGHIKRLINPIESAIKNAEKQISLLQERKQIIINDVVTGKIKVV
jgi:type I restriction enzyme S subunit